MKTVSINVLYFKNGKESHSYRETYNRSLWHCPECASTCVWEEADAGDYYVGQRFICSHCCLEFFMPMASDTSNDEQGKQRIAAIREAE